MGIRNSPKLSESLRNVPKPFRLCFRRISESFGESRRVSESFGEFRKNPPTGSKLYKNDLKLSRLYSWKVILLNFISLCRFVVCCWFHPWSPIGRAWVHRTQSGVCGGGAGASIIDGTNWLKNFLDSQIWLDCKIGLNEFLLTYWMIKNVVSGHETTVTFITRRGEMHCTSPDTRHQCRAMHGARGTKHQGP